MNCKYCGAELDDGVMECPACGKAQTDEEIAAAETDEEAVAAEQTAAEAGAADETAAEKTAAEEVKNCGRTEPCAGCDQLSGCEQAEQYFADELEAQKKAKNIII